MPGLTHTLEIARRAMMTHQSVLSVIGHNIANANVSGYSRQVARLAAEKPLHTTGFDWGNGVGLEGIERRRHLFLDQRVRSEMTALGRWRMRADVLGQIETSLTEPSESGLGAALDDFWNAWSELSSNPQDMALRANLVEKSQVLTERFRTLDQRISSMRAELQVQLAYEVDSFNDKLERLESISRQLVDAEKSGAMANDLRDQRDRLLDEMSLLADISWHEQGDGSLTLRVGNRVVLDAVTREPLSVNRLAGDVTGGSIGALLELREETLPQMGSDLDLLAADLVQQVNARHRTGPSRGDFFSGSSAGEIAVAAEIVNDPLAINASTSGEAGENDIALAIAQLQSERIISGGRMTTSEYWGALVSQLGVMTQEARFQEENGEMVTEATKAQRESVQGVSLDEEMANMVSTQHAYLAAARVFDVASQMLETLMEV